MCIRDREKIIEFSSNLTNIIFNTSNTSIDYIKIFYNPIEYISGKEKNIIIVEIYWMPRPQEICDKLAMEITNFFKMCIRDRDTICNYYKKIFKKNSIIHISI